MHICQEENRPHVSNVQLVLSFNYDDLQHLTGATETPGTTYAYSYDLAGNRTEVRENGTLVANLSYNRC
jgi:YD repeat-containing protein